MEEVPNPFRSEGDDDAVINIGDAVSDNIKSPLLGPSSANETNEEKYARLKARESEILSRIERNKQALDNADGFSNKPNWPKYIPILHILLEEEIPPAAHRCIKVAKVGIILCAAQIITNFIASCSISGLASYKYATGIVFSIIYGFLNGYLTVSVNFTKLYTACRNRDIPFSFLLFQFALIGFLVYQVVGFPSSGSVGMATFLDLIAQSKSVWSKLIAFVNTMLTLACAITQFVVLQQSQKYQKVSGISEFQHNQNTETPLQPL